VLRRFYTVMIVPHGGGGLRKLSVSLNFVLSMAGIFLFCFVSSAFLAHFFLDGMHRIDDAERLRVETDRKDIEIARLRAELVRTVAKTDQLTERLEQHRDAHPESWRGTKAGMGGVSLEEEVERDPVLLTLDDDWRLGARVAQEKADFWMQQLDEQAVCEEDAERASPRGFWPLRDRCRVTSGFQFRRDPLSGRREFHQGIDLAAPRGTPVIATADGKVADARKSGGYGNMVRLDHGDGITTLYGHLRKIHVKEGQTVSRGDVIGEVGSTGRSTGPHLHYEVAESGRPVCPLKNYLLARGDGRVEGAVAGKRAARGGGN
jgi:murein DD-endopeptidase MepM/ murein hydrolase activator NlpD